MALAYEIGKLLPHQKTGPDKSTPSRVHVSADISHVKIGPSATVTDVALDKKGVSTLCIGQEGTACLNSNTLCM